MTKKQWLIIICVIAFFVVAYFIFFNKKSPADQAAMDLDFLRRQGTAPSSEEESLTKSEVNILLKQGTVSATTSFGQPKKELSKEQKESLLKLMSLPGR